MRGGRGYVGAFGRIALMGPLICASCAAPSADPTLGQRLARRDQGVLQPQQITGPCGVIKFIITPQSSTGTGMLVGNLGAPCGFTIFNPALNLTLNAAYVTGQPAHGTASTELANGRRQVAVSYLPAPGYIGHDAFSITIEPDDYAVRVNVTVQATSPVPASTP
jgi:hypothetical protein